MPRKFLLLGREITYLAFVLKLSYLNLDCDDHKSPFPTVSSKLSSRGLDTEASLLPTHNTILFVDHLQAICLCHLYNAVPDGTHNISRCSNPTEAIITVHTSLTHRPPLHTLSNHKTTTNLLPNTNDNPPLLLDERCPKTHRLLRQHLHENLPHSTHNPRNNQHHPIPLPVGN